MNPISIIRQIHEKGFFPYAEAVFAGTLSDAFWHTLLPQEMNTSASSSPYFRIFQAAQVKMHDKGFLSRDIAVQDLILNKCDVHHIFPRNLLKKRGLSRGRYNQIANFVLTQSEINIAIGDKAPNIYFTHLLDQCDGGKKKYGAITDLDDLRKNFKAHCIPDGIEVRTVDDYDDFLEERRKLMAAKLKKYFATL